MMLIGKAKCALGAAAITMLRDEKVEGEAAEQSRALRPGEKIQLANRMYSVRNVTPDGLKVTLDRPLP